MGLEAAFPGHREMVAMLDYAVQQPSPEDITANLTDGMSRLIANGTVRLPEALRQPCGDHYARRLLYRSDDHDYVVVAMTWGPKQGTALHDHDGTWCVEGVLEGQIEVFQYDLLENQGDRCRFRCMGSTRTGVGTAGSLIPPYEYHTIANAQSEAPAITLHVYGREMNECRIFEPVEEDWYQRSVRSLVYDN